MSVRFLALAAMLAALLAPLPSPSAAAESSLEFAARVQERYSQIVAIRAGYIRTSRLQGLAGEAPRTSEAAGVLTYAKPYSLRLEQDRPKPETVVADGDLVWWTRQNRKRADLYPLSDFTSGLNSLFSALSGLGNLQQEFEVIEPTPEEAEHMAAGRGLVLKPLHPMGDLSRLAVWFDEASLLLKGFATTNLLGDITVWEFEEMRPNPEIDSGVFEFRPPADWRVVDHRPLKDAE